MEAEQFEAKEVLDCKDHVVMPGFVDAHGHGDTAPLSPLWILQATGCL